jgi:hypothetical protein
MINILPIILISSTVDWDFTSMTFKLLTVSVNFSYVKDPNLIIESVDSYEMFYTVILVIDAVIGSDASPS